MIKKIAVIAILGILAGCGINESSPKAKAAMKTEQNQILVRIFNMESMRSSAYEGSDSREKDDLKSAYLKEKSKLDIELKDKQVTNWHCTYTGTSKNNFMFSNAQSAECDGMFYTNHAYTDDDMRSGGVVKYSLSPLPVADKMKMGTFYPEDKFKFSGKLTSFSTSNEVVTLGNTSISYNLIKISIQPDHIELIKP